MIDQDYIHAVIFFKLNLFFTGTAGHKFSSRDNPSDIRNPLTIRTD